MVAVCSSRLIEASDFATEFVKVPADKTRQLVVEVPSGDLTMRVGDGATWGGVARFLEIDAEEEVTLFDGRRWLDFAGEVDRNRVQAQTGVDFVVEIKCGEQSVAFSRDATIEEALDALSLGGWLVRKDAKQINGSVAIEALLGGYWSLVAPAPGSLPRIVVHQADLSKNVVIQFARPEGGISRTVVLHGGKRPKKLQLQTLLEECSKEGMVAVCSSRLIEASDFATEFVKVPADKTRQLVVEVPSGDLTMRVGDGATWGGVARFLEIDAEEEVTLFDGRRWLDFAGEVDRNRVQAQTGVDFVVEIKCGEQSVAFSRDATIEEALDMLELRGYELNSSRGVVASNAPISDLAGHSYQLVVACGSKDWSFECSTWDASTKWAVAVAIQVDGEDVGVVPHIASVEQLVAHFAQVPVFVTLDGYENVGLPGSLLVSDLVQPVLGQVDNQKLNVCLHSGGSGETVDLLLSLESDTANEPLAMKVRHATATANLRRFASDLVYVVQSECFVDSGDAEIDDNLPVDRVEPLQFILIPEETNIVCWLRCCGKNSEALDRPCSFPDSCARAEWNRIVQRAARLIVLDRFDDFVVDDKSCEFGQDDLDEFLKKPSGSILKCTAWSQLMSWNIEVHIGAGASAPWTVL